MHWLSRVRSAGARTFDPILAGIDIVLVVGLIVAGLLSHGTSPVADPLASTESVLPFLVGWLAVSTLAGLYRPSRTVVPLQAARWSALCWLAAANVGFLIRGSPLVDGGVAWEFTVVLTGLGLAVIVPVHVVHALVSGERPS